MNGHLCVQYAWRDSNEMSIWHDTMWSIQETRATLVSSVARHSLARTIFTSMPRRTLPNVWRQSWAKRLALTEMQPLHQFPQHLPPWPSPMWSIITSNLWPTPCTSTTPCPEIHPCILQTIFPPSSSSKWLGFRQLLFSYVAILVLLFSIVWGACCCSSCSLEWRCAIMFSTFLHSCQRCIWLFKSSVLCPQNERVMSIHVCFHVPTTIFIKLCEVTHINTYLYSKI
jgi:hypothetical protein